MSFACKNVRRYDTEERAKEVLHFINLRERSRLTPAYCKVCRGFHLRRVIVRTATKRVWDR